MIYRYSVLTSRSCVTLSFVIVSGPVSTQTKSDFAILCRTLRIQKGYKQREVALAIGIRPSTYGNVESSRWKVIRRERAERLAAFLQLMPDDHDRLLEAWEKCPLSEYGERVRERWKRRNERRNKVKMHDRIQISLIEMTAMCLAVARNPDTLCTCEFGGGTIDDPDRACELCEALMALGLNRLSDVEQSIADLAKLQEKLEAEAGRKTGGSLAGAS